MQVPATLLIARRRLATLARAGLVVGAAFSVSACLSDSDDNPPPTTSSERVAVGAITGFGSVYVNGVAYDTTDASFATDDNEAATEDDFGVGMLVSVTSSSESSGNRAVTIRYEKSLQGPVSEIDLSNGVLTVVGQQVSFDDSTVFDDISPETLQLNDFIEVSGFETAAGSWFASRIELETEEQEIELRGSVNALDTAAQTFEIGNLTVDYSVAELDDFGGSALADGQRVKVEGTDFTQSTVTLRADEVELRSNQTPDLDGIDEIELLGTIANFDNEAGTFELNDYLLTLTTDTEFDDLTRDDLQNGLRVKVEAEVEDGVLVVDEIEAAEKRIGNKTEGQVTEVDLTAGTFTLGTTLYSVDEQTRFIDESVIGDRQFGLDAIAVNDWLKVVAERNDDGTLTAIKVKRIDDDSLEGELKGVPGDVSDIGFTLNGVSVVFTEATEFEADDDDSLSAAAFIDLLDETTVVEVEGVYDGNQLVAREVEIEDDEDDVTGERRGEIEIKGFISEVNGEQFFVGAIDFRLLESSDLEIDDTDVDLATFVDALATGLAVEVEGRWDAEGGFVAVKEAELTITGDDDDDDDDD